MSCSCLSLRPKSQQASKNYTNKAHHSGKFHIQQMLEKTRKNEQYDQIFQISELENMLFSDLQLNFLNYAISKGNSGLVLYFLRELDKYMGNNSMSKAYDKVCLRNQRIKETQQQEGADKHHKVFSNKSLSSVDIHQNTALHLAASYNQLEITQAILEYVNNHNYQFPDAQEYINKRNNSNETPFEVARMYSNITIMNVYQKQLIDFSGRLTTAAQQPRLGTSQQLMMSQQMGQGSRSFKVAHVLKTSDSQKDDGMKFPELVIQTKSIKSIKKIVEEDDNQQFEIDHKKLEELKKMQALDQRAGSDNEEASEDGARLQNVIRISARSLEPKKSILQGRAVSKIELEQIQYTDQEQKWKKPSIGWI